MKILIHNKEKDTTPENVKVLTDLSSVFILTMNDIIHDNDSSINSLRGMYLSTILIPKLFGYYQNSEVILNNQLNKTKLWGMIKETFTETTKIIFY